MKVVSISRATVRHLDHILFKELSFEVEQGQQWAVLGKSGAGKSALLHTLKGVFNVLEGSLEYPLLVQKKQALNIQDPLFTYDKMIAFVRQQAHFRNRENMANLFYQQRYHAHFSEEAATVKEYLSQDDHSSTFSLPEMFSLEWIIEKLQLDTLLDKTLIQLSNGETRRLMIAKALLKQPVLLLMDNPFVGLDRETRPILRQLLEEIKEKGVTVIMATSFKEIPESVTHVLYLTHQKVDFMGPRDSFRDGPMGDERPSDDWKLDLDLFHFIEERSPDQQVGFEDAVKMENVVVKSKGKFILKAINWHIKKGEKWALVGHNGAGKSTLLSLINGDHPQAYANAISIFDKKRGSGESIWELKHRIGYVSPEMHQFFKNNTTVIEVILSGLYDTMKFKKSKAKPAEVELAENWLKLLDLASLKNQNFREISMGKQRLVLLLRALIKNPPLLILDEPCQGLDEQQKDHFKHIINLTCNQKNKTILYVSHYREDIPTIINKVLILEKGEIKA